MTSKKKGKGGAPKGSRGADDDERLWAALSKTVKPLKRRQPPPISADGGTSAPRKTPEAGARPKKNTAAVPRPRYVPPPPPPPVAQAPSVLGHGDAPGVDKRTAAKLRRGLMPIEATLDLHGQTRETARTRLTAFITGHHAAGRRCLLVVTGKGLKEDWTPGVIRSAVPEWLNEPPLRPLVLSFATAQPHHGGSGAIYVLLKRAR